MKKTVFCLFVLIFIITAGMTASSESAVLSLPSSIKDLMTIPADYEIDRFIQGQPIQYIVGDFSITLVEAAADPEILFTNIVCSSMNPAE